MRVEWTKFRLGQGRSRGDPDYSQSHFGEEPTNSLRIRLSRSSLVQHAGTTLRISLRIRLPRSAWGAQECPRLQPEPFWDDPTVPAYYGSRLPRSAQPRDSKKGLSECLAFLTYTQNYFELDCVFSSHP